MTSKAFQNKVRLNEASAIDIDALPAAEEPLGGDEPIAILQDGVTKKVPASALGGTGDDAQASGDPIITIATDKISTAAEAAQFLRQAALGGGTWQEIQAVLAAGSRKRWLEEQIFTPDYLRVNPIYNINDATLPAPGYFSNVCRTLFPPRGSTGTTAPAFIFSSESFTNRCLLTALLNNANVDSGATTFHNAVGSNGSLNGGKAGASGYDLLETVRLKATWILSKFIPCSTPGGAWDATDKTTSIAMWYALLHRGAFGTYADLLEEVTYSPPMSLMLTYIANQKEEDGRQPDENYAREIMQLFTIGLYELNIDGTYKTTSGGDRIPTYGNEDVYALSKVFTGLCRNDFADFDVNKNQGNTFNSWQTGQWPWYYEEGTTARRAEMAYTPVTAGIHNICSFDGNLTFNGVDLRSLSATTTVAIPATGGISTITVNSTTNWPASGAVKIDNEIFYYTATSATTFTVRAVDPGTGAPTYTRGHWMSPTEAHPIGSTVRYWRPYWYEPGVSARLRHYLPFYDRGAKYALKGRINIPADTEPTKNIRMAIEGLVSHPSCAPYVCKNLIKHMVTSNPSPSYVARVARVFENDGQGVRGNLAAVWMAILTDPEACNTTQSSQYFGRIREGFELFANVHRSFHRISRGRPLGATNSSAVYINGVYQTADYSGFLNTWGDIRLIGVWPNYQPSIFGFYSPEYAVAPGSTWGLVTPELGAYSFYSLMEHTHQTINRIVGNEPRDVASHMANADLLVAQMSPAPTTNYDNSVSGTATGADLAERMNLLLCGGNLSAAKKSVLAQQVSSLVSTEDERQNRITGVIQLITYTPEFFTQ